MQRYNRQILFPNIGREGQEKLLKSRVLLIGCGALGSLHAEMLARAGVGHLRIVDRDFVDFSNLQRQTLFTESDAENRVPKAAAAAERLAEFNSEITIEPIIADVNPSNIESLLDKCDLIMDGTDNFQARYLINDASIKHGIPWIYGAAVSSYGTAMTIIPGKTPCLQCVFEEMPDAGTAPTCDTAGVIMPIIAAVSSVQTAEAIKILVGDFDALHDSLVQIDMWQNDWRRIGLGVPNPDCKACSLRSFEFLDVETREFSAVLCGRNSVQIAPPKAASVDLPALADRLGNISSVKLNQYLVRFDFENHEITVFSDGRAIIGGTDDISVARSIYARYIGT